MVAPLALGAIALGAGLAYAKHDKAPPVGGPPTAVGDVATSSTPGAGAIGGTPFTIATVTIPAGMNVLLSGSVTLENGDTANGRRVVCDIRNAPTGINVHQVQGILGAQRLRGQRASAPDPHPDRALRRWRPVPPRVLDAESRGRRQRAVDGKLTALVVRQIDRQ